MNRASLLAAPLLVLLPALSAFADDPPAIADIHASFADGHVTLTWTAPHGEKAGDPPGPALSYEFRYIRGHPFAPDNSDFKDPEAPVVPMVETVQPAAPDSPESVTFPFEFGPGVILYFGIMYITQEDLKSLVGSSNPLPEEGNPETPPAAIMTLREVGGATTDTSTELAWDLTPAGADTIRVYHSGSSGGGEWATIGARQVAVGGLQPGSTYSMYVRVRHGDGPESLPSNSVVISTTGAVGETRKSAARCGAGGSATLIVTIAAMLLLASPRIRQ